MAESRWEFFQSLRHARDDPIPGGLVKAANVEAGTCWAQLDQQEISAGTVSSAVSALRAQLEQRTFQSSA